MELNSAYCVAEKRGLKGIIFTFHCPLPDRISHAVRMAPEETRARLLGEAECVVRETFGGAVTRVVTCSAFVGRRP